MSNYATGARIERLGITLLRRNGYYCMRSAGSKGAFDIICWRAESGDDMRCIQFKKAESFDKSDFAKMEAVAVPPGAVRELWSWDGTGDWECWWHGGAPGKWTRRTGVEL